MANSNVNIGNRLFAYIAHSADVNTYITTQYNNSMLFIGDEQQIYVPAMGAYVGIGMTAYNNTMNFVLDVNDKLTELEKALKSSMVSKIYPQWNNKEFGGAITNMTYLTQEITIKGIGDYDPSTGFSYTSYTVRNATGTELECDVTTTNNKHYASSGISVTYYSTPAQTNSDGSITPGENYIVIDDKLTWSYIANAYTYSMNFAKKYTATEVERLYHNLLGDGDINNAYLPADFHEAFIEVIQNPTDEDGNNSGTPATSVKLHVLNNADGRKYWYKKVVNATLPADTTPEAYVKANSSTIDGFEKAPNGTITFWKWTEYTLTGEGAATDTTATEALSMYAERAHVAENTDIRVPQLYIYSDEYNYTYNINIADGIQTLKEVAYLLDVLTDGLGELTYISHAEYAALEDTTGYYRVIGTAYSTSNYAYYFKQNPENLGLQMAYSLASLKIDTNDLHNHTNWLEDGATTLRSVVAQGSKFANVTIDGQHNVKLTDHNKSVAGENEHFEDGITTWYANKAANQPQTGSEATNIRQNWSGNSYTLGDADIRLKLDLTQTYMTVETKLGEVTDVDLPDYRDIYGVDAHVVTIGGNKVVLQAADMAQIIPAGASYYTIAVDGENGEVATLVSDPITNVHNQGNLQYYWQPSTDAIQQHYINTKFKKVDDVYIANADANYNFYIESADIATSTVTGLDAQGAQYVKLTKAQALTANSKGVQVYIIKTKQVGANTVLESEAGTIRPVIDNRDAIATASWVASYLTAAISGLGDQFDDILEEAKRYTDQKIDELDSESLYSDFGANVWDAWCAANISGEYKDSTGTTRTGTGSIIFNSSDYNTAKTAHYAYYKSTNGTDTAPSALAKRAVDLYGENSDPVSLYNRQYSEYVYSTVEENGIVKTETRELPVDRISSRTEVWGTNSSTVYQRTFAALDTATVTDDLNGDPDVSSAAANDKLFAFVSTKTYDNNIYVQTADEYEYQPIVAANYATIYDDNTNGGPTKMFFVNSKNGKFVAISESEEDWYGANFTVTSIDGIHAPRFVQLYTRTPKYAEVDLETIVWANDYSAITGCYAEGVQYTNASGLDLFYIPGENNGDPVGDPRNNAVTANKQYISTHYKHYSATSTTHGSTPGHGENEFEVVTYITNLEDATKNNTGLADAYDVKTFVENFFNWVDVSATVTQDNIETNVAWYDKISFYKYNSATNKPTLYWYNSEQSKFVAVTTPTDAYAAGQNYTDESGQETVNGVPVKGPAIWGDPDTTAAQQHTYTGWVMGSTAPGAAATDRQTYYVLNSQAKTNNINLTLTKYTTKVINWTDRVN